jgi:hypothetical protein
MQVVRTAAAGAMARAATAVSGWSERRNTLLHVQQRWTPSTDAVVSDAALCHCLAGGGYGGGYQQQGGYGGGYGGGY